MKNISKLLFLVLTVSLSLFSCADIQEPVNTIPVLNAPKVARNEPGITYLAVSPSGHRSNYQYVIVSLTPDMQNPKRFSISPDVYAVGKAAILTGLTPGATYYAQYVEAVICDENDETFEAKSPVMSFTVPAYDPTSYSISLPYVPYKDYYGVMTAERYGKTSYERLYPTGNNNNRLIPTTQITGDADIYVILPAATRVADSKSVVVAGGENDYYLGQGYAHPHSTSPQINMSQYTAHVTLSITFNSAKEDASDLQLTSVAITNVKGNSPICLDGNLDLAKRTFTPSANGRTKYEIPSSTSIHSGSVIGRTFWGVIPVSFDNNTVKAVINVSGDVTDNEISVPIPASTWTAGSNVTVKLNATYTAKTLEISVSGVEVKPWEEGSTGDINVIK